jgi:Domain of unknown function (DUF222)
VLEVTFPLLLTNTGTLRLLAEAEPGLSVMATLGVFDPTELSDDDRLYFVEAWERQQAWVAAQAIPALVTIAGVRPDRSDEFAREEVRAALRLSAVGAQQRIDVARALSGPLVATREALELGRITFLHAVVLTEAVAELDTEKAQAVEARVLERCETQTIAEFKRSVKRAVAAVDPATFEVAHEVAAAHRRVAHYDEPDCMATIAAFLPAADARTVWLALDTRARANPDRTLGIDARRADALVQLATEALADPGSPRRHRRPVQIQVTIDLPTLLGLREHPAELLGYGPIPADVARLLASDATWRRLVVEPVTGHLLDFGQTVYRPPKELADFLAARDVACRFPTCNRSASDCDIDHALAHHRGGATSAQNCGHACRRHHRLKQSGWDLRSNPDGSAVWTSPRGRQYCTPAVDHQPDTS